MLTCVNHCKSIFGTSHLISFFHGFVSLSKKRQLLRSESGPRPRQVSSWRRTFYHFHHSSTKTRSRRSGPVPRQLKKNTSHSTVKWKTVKSDASDVCHWCEIPIPFAVFLLLSSLNTLRMCQMMCFYRCRGWCLKKSWENFWWFSGLSIHWGVADMAWLTVTLRCRPAEDRMHLPPDWVEVVPPGWGMQGKSYYKNSSLKGELDETMRPVRHQEPVSGYHLKIIWNKPVV